MCGICGIWGVSNRQAVSAMVDCMHHRGPDDEGIYCGPNTALGMTRLSILDLSSNAKQPMSNAAGTQWIVYNGEIYNYRQERTILESKGYRFRSRSDTEVVLCMYEHYGDDFLHRLRGIFALAVYDQREGPGRERLVLARDHFGVKPLLFTRSKGRVIFASEMKAVISSGLVKAEIDPVSLRMLLTYGSVPSPRTILKDVWMLPPAHKAVVDATGERLEKYWNLGTNRHPEVRMMPYSDQVRLVTEILDKTIQLQTVSDVPLGAFLSGGIDSSLLVAMMAQHAGRRIKTFSLGFEEESENDESYEAGRTATFLGTDHVRYVITGPEVRDRIRHIAWSLDQPSFDGTNSYFVSLVAAKEVTVALSGTGGDEVFAGYPWFLNACSENRPSSGNGLAWNPASHCAGLVHQPILDRLVSGRVGELITRARTEASIRARYCHHYRLFGTIQAARLLSTEIAGTAQIGRSPHHDLADLDEIPNGSPIERFSGFIIRGFTVNQLLRDIDVMSMSHSLEVRVPYLDTLVTDYALSLPDEAKVRPFNGERPQHTGAYRDTGLKRILVDIAKQMLPTDMDMRPKRGFNLSQELWLKGPLKEVLMDSLSDESIENRGLFDRGQVRAVENNFLNGSKQNWALPWALMMIELWAREVLDVPASSLKTPPAI
jgi:asparagine synthase (glutamine-hydrolysing)